jgi:hypothetical protein
MKTKYSYVGRYSCGGSQNSFYKVKGKKYGFKSFPNKSLATFAHKVQDVLSQEYLAPYVLSPVCRIRVPNYFMGQNSKIEAHMVLSDWGYLTEIAKPFNCKSGDYCSGDCANDDGCLHNDSVRTLLNDIEGCGLTYNDAHPGNLGYVIRGDKKVLVVIDCGAESVVDEDGNYPEVCWDGAEDMYCECEKCCNRCDYA